MAGRVGPAHAAGKEALTSLLTFKVAWRDLLYQIYFIGVKSQSVVLITGAFTGMVLARRPTSSFTKSKWTPPRWRW